MSRTHQTALVGSHLLALFPSVVLMQRANAFSRPLPQDAKITKKQLAQSCSSHLNDVLSTLCASARGCLSPGPLLSGDNHREIGGGAVCHADFIINLNHAAENLVEPICARKEGLAGAR